MPLPDLPRFDRRTVEVLGNLTFNRLDALLPENFPEAQADQVGELLSTAITTAYYAGHYHGQNGEPISPHTLPDVFERFDQA